MPEKIHFRLSFHNCKSCVYNCDDLLSYNSSPSSSHNYMIFIYSELQAESMFLHETTLPKQLKYSGRIYDRVNVLTINLTRSFSANSFFSLAFDVLMHTAKNLSQFFLLFPKRGPNITRQLAFHQRHLLNIP